MAVECMTLPKGSALAFMKPEVGASHLPGGKAVRIFDNSCPYSWPRKVDHCQLEWQCPAQWPGLVSPLTLIITWGITWEPRIIHLCCKCLLGTYCVPASVLGVGMERWTEGQRLTVWRLQCTRNILGSGGEGLLLVLEILQGRDGWRPACWFLLEEIRSRTDHRIKSQRREPSFGGIPGPMKTPPGGRVPLVWRENPRHYLI
jgi:hypothetical protein